MMVALGFNSHWVKLVMTCVTTVSYKIKFNGSMGESFTPKRGIRQGDPISPYLFILAVEGLSTLIHEAITRGRLSEIELTRNCPTLSHLMFVDEVMILTKVVEANVYELQRILNCYSLAFRAKNKFLKI